MEMGFQVKLAFLFCAVIMCGYLAEGLTRFSELKKSMIVETGAANGTKAGEGHVSVSWRLNTTAVSQEAAAAAGYTTVVIQLCFGAVSQTDRGWRKTVDLLAKDKTCLFTMGTQPFTADGNNITWTVSKEVPFAHYFVRGYVKNAAKEKIAYGQNTDQARKTNLFTIEPITGRHASIDIAAGVFSAFSVVSLFGFYFFEKRMAKKGA